MKRYGIKIRFNGCDFLYGRPAGKKTIQSTILGLEAKGIRKRDIEILPVKNYSPLPYVFLGIALGGLGAWGLKKLHDYLLQLKTSTEPK